MFCIPTQFVKRVSAAAADMLGSIVVSSGLNAPFLEIFQSVSCNKLSFVKFDFEKSRKPILEFKSIF